jgi:hypothetical protein
MALFITVELMSCCAELAFTDPHVTHENRAARRQYLKKHPRRTSALALLFALACGLAGATGAWFLDLALDAMRTQQPVSSTQVWLACVPLIVGYLLAASVLAELAWAAGYARMAWAALRSVHTRSRGFRIVRDPDDEHKPGPLDGLRNIDASAFDRDDNDGDGDSDAMQQLPGTEMTVLGGDK